MKKFSISQICAQLTLVNKGGKIPLPAAISLRQAERSVSMFSRSATQPFGLPLRLTDFQTQFIFDVEQIVVLIFFATI